MVGYPIFPVYMAKAGGFFFIVFGVLVLMGGLMQINPVWAYGPYNPAEVIGRLAARLVHGLRRGRDPDHAELGVAHRRHDLVVERRDPRSRDDGSVLRR